MLPVLGFKPAPSGFDLNGDGRIDFEDFRACALAACISLELPQGI